jgi:hypothetical protein
MFLGGSAISIPLTLLQSVSSKDSFGVVNLPPEQFLVNILLSLAIYGKDRAEGEEDVMIPVSRVSAILSTIYLQHDWLLSFFVVVLHLYYTDTKKYFANVKPYVVSFFWTLASNEPQIHMHTSLSPLVLSWLTVVSLFLSHSSDIEDIEEDQKEGILTPACLMGREESTTYGLGVCLSAICIHMMTSHYDGVDKGIDILTLLVGIKMVVERQVFLIVSIVSGTLFSCILLENRLHILNTFFLSTSYPHEKALTTTVKVTEWAQFLPGDKREFVLHTLGHILDVFDTLGHQLLHLYSSVLVHL